MPQLTEMPVETEVRIRGVRKAAILLISLGDTASAEIIRQLPEAELQLVSMEIARLDSVSPDQVEAVLGEFQQLKMAEESFARGGADYASRMLVNAFGPGPAGRLLNRITKLTGGADDKQVAALRQADPQQLVPFIQNEHPQTIALILSNLSPAQAGVLLMSLPAEIRPDIAMRMANLDHISPEVFNRIIAVVGGKLKAIGQVRRAGGARVVADMLNGIDSTAAKEIMASIGQTDTNLIETIQHLMFIFDDLLLFNKDSIKVLLGKVDRKVLTMALKGTSNQLKTHFTQCMSQRGAEMLKDDMEALGAVRIKDVEGAQQQIITIVRQLQAEGLINLKGSADQYVT